MSERHERVRLKKVDYSERLFTLDARVPCAKRSVERDIANPERGRIHHNCSPTGYTLKHRYLISV